MNDSGDEFSDLMSFILNDTDQEKRGNNISNQLGSTKLVQQGADSEETVGSVGEMASGDAGGQTPKCVDLGRGDAVSEPVQSNIPERLSSTTGGESQIGKANAKPLAKQSANDSVRTQASVTGVGKTSVASPDRKPAVENPAGVPIKDSLSQLGPKAVTKPDSTTLGKSSDAKSKVSSATNTQTKSKDDTDPKPKTKKPTTASVNIKSAVDSSAKTVTKAASDSITKPVTTDAAKTVTRSVTSTVTSSTTKTVNSSSIKTVVKTAIKIASSPATKPVTSTATKTNTNSAAKTSISSLMKTVTITATKTVTSCATKTMTSSATKNITSSATKTTSCSTKTTASVTKPLSSTHTNSVTGSAKKPVTRSVHSTAQQHEQSVSTPALRAKSSPAVKEMTSSATKATTCTTTSTLATKPAVGDAENSSGLIIRRTDTCISAIKVTSVESLSEVIPESALQCAAGTPTLCTDTSSNSFFDEHASKLSELAKVPVISPSGIVTSSIISDPSLSSSINSENHANDIPLQQEKLSTPVPTTSTFDILSSIKEEITYDDAAYGVSQTVSVSSLSDIIPSPGVSETVSTAIVNGTLPGANALDTPLGDSVSHTTPDVAVPGQSDNSNSDGCHSYNSNTVNEVLKQIVLKLHPSEQPAAAVSVKEEPPDVDSADQVEPTPGPSTSREEQNIIKVIASVASGRLGGPSSFGMSSKKAGPRSAQVAGSSKPKLIPMITKLTDEMIAFYTKQSVGGASLSAKIGEASTSKKGTSQTTATKISGKATTENVPASKKGKGSVKKGVNAKNSANKTAVVRLELLPDLVSKLKNEENDGNSAIESHSAVRLRRKPEQPTSKLKTKPDIKVEIDQAEDVSFESPDNSLEPGSAVTANAGDSLLSEKEIKKEAADGKELILNEDEGSANQACTNQDKDANSCSVIKGKKDVSNEESEQQNVDNVLAKTSKTKEKSLNEDKVDGAAKANSKTCEAKAKASTEKSHAKVDISKRKTSQDKDSNDAEKRIEKVKKEKGKEHSNNRKESKADYQEGKNSHAKEKVQQLEEKMSGDRTKSTMSSADPDKTEKRDILNKRKSVSGSEKREADKPKNKVLKASEGKSQSDRGRSPPKTLLDKNMAKYLNDANGSGVDKSVSKFTIPRRQIRSRSRSKERVSRGTVKRSSERKESPSHSPVRKRHKESGGSRKGVAKDAENPWKVEPGDKEKIGKIPSVFDVDTSTSMWKAKDALRRQGGLLELSVEGFHLKDLYVIVQMFTEILKLDNFEIYKSSTSSSVSIFIKCAQLKQVKDALTQLYALNLTGPTLTIGLKHVGVYPAIEIYLKVNLLNKTCVFENTLRSEDSGMYEAAYQGQMHNVPSMCYPYVILGCNWVQFDFPARETQQNSQPVESENRELRFVFNSKSRCDNFASFYRDVWINGCRLSRSYRGTLRPYSHKFNLNFEKQVGCTNPAGLVFSKSTERLMPKKTTELPIQYMAVLFPQVECKISNAVPKLVKPGLRKASLFKETSEEQKSTPQVSPDSEGEASCTAVAGKTSGVLSGPDIVESQASQWATQGPPVYNQGTQSLPQATINQGPPISQDASLRNHAPLFASPSPTIQNSPSITQGPSNMKQTTTPTSQEQFMIQVMNQALPPVSQGPPVMVGPPSMWQAPPMMRGPPPASQGLPMMRGPPPMSRVPPPANQGPCMMRGPPTMSGVPPPANPHMMTGPPRMSQVWPPASQGPPMMTGCPPFNTSLPQGYPPFNPRPPLMNQTVGPPMMQGSCPYGQGPMMPNLQPPMFSTPQPVPPPMLPNPGPMAPAVMHQDPLKPMNELSEISSSNSLDNLLDTPTPTPIEANNGDDWESSVQKFTESLLIGKPINDVCRVLDRSSSKDSMRDRSLSPNRGDFARRRSNSKDSTSRNWQKLSNRQRSNNPFASSRNKWKLQHRQRSNTPDAGSRKRRRSPHQQGSSSRDLLLRNRNRSPLRQRSRSPCSISRNRYKSPLRLRSRSPDSSSRNRQRSSSPDSLSRNRHRSPFRLRSISPDSLSKVKQKSSQQRGSFSPDVPAKESDKLIQNSPVRKQMGRSRSPHQKKKRVDSSSSRKSKSPDKDKQAKVNPNPILLSSSPDREKHSGKDKTKESIAADSSSMKNIAIAVNNKATTPTQTLVMEDQRADEGKAQKKEIEGMSSSSLSDKEKVMDSVLMDLMTAQQMESDPITQLQLLTSLKSKLAEIMDSGDSLAPDVEQSKGSRAQKEDLEETKQAKKSKLGKTKRNYRKHSFLDKEESSSSRRLSTEGSDRPQSEQSPHAADSRDTAILSRLQPISSQRLHGKGLGDVYRPTDKTKDYEIVNNSVHDGFDTRQSLSSSPQSRSRTTGKDKDSSQPLRRLKMKGSRDDRQSSKYRDETHNTLAQGDNLREWHCVADDRLSSRHSYRTDDPVPHQDNLREKHRASDNHQPSQCPDRTQESLLHRQGSREKPKAADVRQDDRQLSKYPKQTPDLHGHFASRDKHNAAAAEHNSGYSSRPLRSEAVGQGGVRLQYSDIESEGDEGKHRQPDKARDVRDSLSKTSQLSDESPKPSNFQQKVMDAIARKLKAPSQDKKQTLPGPVDMESIEKILAALANPGE